MDKRLYDWILEYDFPQVSDTEVIWQQHFKTFCAALAGKRMQLFGK